MKGTATPATARPRPRQAGFTLIETLIAIVIIVFGLIGVTNLFMVAASSNAVANQGTAATAAASQLLERLKAVPFTTLQSGGTIEADAGTAGDCFGVSAVDVGNPAALNNCNADLAGVGRIHVRWAVTNVAGNPQVRFVQVRAEALGTLGPARTRAEFTTFRSCTSTTIGCPVP
jgi:prepilin-type N-terminal cleavage/methylation domain-containing protein